MSSGMNRAQAEEYAKTMTYKQAIGNIWNGKGIAYRKATTIKLHELAEIADKLVLCKDCRHRNTWDNQSLEPKYYRCGMGIKFRDFGFVREDDYCPLGERGEE